MKRIAALLTALCVLMTGCGNTLSGSGRVDVPVSSPELSVAEFPDADEPLPIEEESSEPGSIAPVPEESAQEPARETEPSSQEEQSSSQPQTVSSEAAVSAPETTPVRTPQTSGEVRAVWVSYLEFLNIAQNRSRQQFVSSVSSMFEEAADLGLNTVYVQVRPFGDALYDSAYFPWSYVLTGEEGGDPGYDPLEEMIACARAEGLSIEAWINPYRVRAAGSTRALAASNPAQKAIASGTSLAIAYNGGVFYNPASQEARDLITDGVVEILQNYDVDGIHFDDYFYPTTDAAFDSADYAAYQNGGGTLPLAAWRRENVTALIRQVSSAVRRTSSSARFGISPQARMDINYNQQYADLEAWCDAGYLDYICPQIYFGFDHKTVPFEECASQWSDVVRGTDTTLLIGLAAYKCGVYDSYAGDGANEWVENTDLLAQMVRCARKMSGYGGFAVYRYDSLFSPDAAVRSAVTSERSSLASIL